MTHYSEKPEMVRVDFFKESGKWEYTEAVKWDAPYDDSLIQDCFAEVLVKHFGENIRLSGMTAVCLEPYHKHAHPIMMKVDDAWAMVEHGG